MHLISANSDSPISARFAALSDGEASSASNRIMRGNGGWSPVRRRNTVQNASQAEAEAETLPTVRGGTALIHKYFEACNKKLPLTKT